MAGLDHARVDEERPVDTAAIVREIEAEVARRRDAGEYPTRLLEALHADFAIPVEDEPPELMAMMNTVYPIEANRRPRRLIINSKKVIRRLLAWYVQPIAVEQTRFNYSILQEMRRLERRVSRIETPWRSAAAGLSGAAARSWRAMAVARANAIRPLLERSGADPVLVLGDDDAVAATLRGHGVALTELPDDGRPSVHDHHDAVAALEKVAPSSLGGIVLAGVIPRLSPAEMLMIIPLAAHGLKKDGLLVVDAPDPRHPLAPPDPSALDPAMRRWVTVDTIGLLCEAAGLVIAGETSADADGCPGWRAVIARRVQGHAGG